MHIAEEVRTKTNHLRGLFGQHELREMLLAYADLLEKCEVEQRELSSARAEVSVLRAALECIAEGCSFPSDSVQVAVRDRARAALAATLKEEVSG